MVATFSVMFDYAGSNAGSPTPPTSADVDLLGPPMLRFKNADDAVIDENDKLQVPGEGTKYSFWKHVYLKCDDPDGHTINNIAIYGDAANGWDPHVDIKVGDETPERNYNGGSPSYAGYEVAAEDEDLVTYHSGITGAASLWAYSAGEATDLDVSISESGTVIDAANETCDYVVSQMEVYDTATALIGDLDDETGFFSYDEA